MGCYFWVRCGIINGRIIGPKFYETTPISSATVVPLNISVGRTFGFVGTRFTREWKCYDFAADGAPPYNARERGLTVCRT